tara:strand:+ start:273 stop:644 length:372 start_codon:yes stop_codon:yes gene_type:complete
MKFFKLFLVFVITIILTSCTDKPTYGIVRVVDLLDGSSIANATVTISVQNPDAISPTGFYICNENDMSASRSYKTLSSGSTERICFKLPAVLQVDVSTGDGKSGSTTLSAEEGETTTVTCKVN